MECPTRFGRFILIRRLAVGGMAEIYLAKVAGLAGIEKHLVLKVIHPKFAQDPEFVEMLVSEAKLVVRLTHPNIAQVFDLGVIEDRYYIAMEFVDGLDTHQLLRRVRARKTRMPVEVAVYITAEVCAGLDHAHNRLDEEGRPLAIIHRDISPQNVLVSYSGDVKIIDFGIAKARARSQNTGVGIIKGKFFYMSPEQARGKVLDSRSDIFSVGVLFYELLTNRMLYDTESMRDALKLARKASFLPPRAHRPDVPVALERILLKALARVPDERYQTANALRTALTSWLRRSAAGFGRHRLEEWVRDVCELGKRPRYSSIARQDFEVERKHSVIFRSAPEGSDDEDDTDVQLGRGLDDSTREIASRPRTGRHRDAGGRPTTPSEILRRRVAAARAKLGLRDSSPGESFDPTVEMYDAPTAIVELPDSDAILPAVPPPVPADAVAKAAARRRAADKVYDEVREAIQAQAKGARSAAPTATEEEDGGDVPTKKLSPSARPFRWPPIKQPERAADAARSGGAGPHSTVGSPAPARSAPPAGSPAPVSSAAPVGSAPPAGSPAPAASVPAGSGAAAGPVAPAAVFGEGPLIEDDAPTHKVDMMSLAWAAGDRPEDDVPTDPDPQPFLARALVGSRRPNRKRTGISPWLLVLLALITLVSLGYLLYLLLVNGLGADSGG